MSADRRRSFRTAERAMSDAAALGLLVGSALVLAVAVAVFTLGGG